MSQAENKKPAGKGNRPQIDKGVTVLCPRKKHVIGTLKSPFISGEALRPDKIKFNQGQHRNAGEKIACEICGSVYFLQGRLYTENGWYPNDPRLEPVSPPKRRN